MGSTRTGWQFWMSWRSTAADTTQATPATRRAWTCNGHSVVADSARLLLYSAKGSFIPDSNWPENNNDPILDYLISQPDIPPTIYTSYGGNAQAFPPDYVRSVCELLVQLGLRGVSFLFASLREHEKLQRCPVPTLLPFDLNVSPPGSSPRT